MSTTAEARLQALIEEEKVMKTMLMHVKSKLFQLQLESMTLKKTQADLNSKSRTQQGSDDTTQMPVRLPQVQDDKVLERSSSETGDGFSDGMLLSNINNQASVNETNHFSGFPEHIEGMGYESQSDNEMCEEDLDDPSIMNQFKLNDGLPLSELVFSEVDSSDEEENLE